MNIGQSIYSLPCCYSIGNNFQQRPMLKSYSTAEKENSSQNIKANFKE